MTDNAVPNAVPNAARPFRFPVRVYWEDTDAGGVVFYANYLKYFERARTEWLRSLGQQQERMRVDTGTVFIVTDTAIRYLRPARLDDLLSISVVLTHAGRARMTIAQQAWRRSANSSGSSGSDSGGNDNGGDDSGEDDSDSGDSDELLAEGTIRIGCVDAGTFRPQRIPNAIVETLPASTLAASTPGRHRDSPRSHSQRLDEPHRMNRA